MISCPSLTRLLPHSSFTILPSTSRSTSFGASASQNLVGDFSLLRSQIRIMKETEIRNAIVFKTMLIKDMQSTVMVMCLSINYLVR